MAKKYLDYDGLLYFWQKIKNLFALASHTHTKSQITDFPTSMTPTAHEHGEITNEGLLSPATATTVANGDQLIISDSSASRKIVGGPTFDGTTDTKALTPKGTWETFLKAGDVPEGAVTEVTVAGTSVVSAGVAAIPAASSTAYGAIKVAATGDPSNYRGINITTDGNTTYSVPRTISNGGYTLIDYGFLPEATTGHKGAMSATDKTKLDSITMTNGIIDSSVLPSFVDDVIEAYARTNQTELSSTWLATGSASGTVITPETGKIYVLMNDSTSYSTNSQFRWGGSAYVKLNDGGVSEITNSEIDTIVAS